MADNDKRGADRVPAALRLKLRYTDVESFIDKYSANVSKGGIFIASKTPKPVGTVLRFEFQLADGSPVVRGEGKVVWVKELDPAHPQKPHGMGLKFTRLDAHSKAILDRMIAIKGHPRGESIAMGPIVGEGSGMAPLPGEGSGMQPIPTQGSGPQIGEGSGMLPLPAQGSGPQIVEGSGPRAVPAEGSGPRPVPPEKSGPRAIPAEGSGPRPVPPEKSGPRPVAPPRPIPKIEPPAAIPITLTLKPALEELEALAREIGFTDEALAAAVARAREIAARANGDINALLEAPLRGVGHEASPPPPAAPPRGRPDPVRAPLAPGAARAAARAPSFDDDEERTQVDQGLGRIAARVLDGSGEEGTTPGLGNADEEATMHGFDSAGEEDPTPLDVEAPYDDGGPKPPEGPAGGPRRGRLGDVVKEYFRK